MLVRKLLAHVALVSSGLVWAVRWKYHSHSHDCSQAKDLETLPEIIIDEGTFKYVSLQK